MYRIFNSQVPSPGSTVGTTRKIWKVTASAPVSLTAGTYWIKYQLQNVTIANGGFLPPVTIAGNRGLAGWNAKQLDAVNGTWTSLFDDGNPSSAPDYPMDMPFVITFTSSGLGTREVMQYDNRIQIYPNPVENIFRINNPEKISITSIEIMDMSGKIIRSLKGSEEYNVSDLQKGIYLIKIKSSEISKITKLVKQ